MAKNRIMIVEDERIVAKDIQNMLKRIGYEVPVAVASGEEAVQKAAEIQPDLVLMDIMLKGQIDGVEAAEQIRATHQIPVIYITAYADKNTLQRAKVTEPYGYILKPFQERELNTAIEIALYRHRMEKKLRENEKWLSTTLKSIGDAVITTNAEGYITFMNPVARFLTGWQQEEALGKPLEDVFKTIDEETSEPIESPVTKVIREDVVVELSDYALLITRDGSEIFIDDSSAPIKDDMGNLIGVVLVFHDVTERKRMEKEILKAQKIESVGVLAGGIAHDFNNILTAIIGNISLARLYTDPEKISERLAESERAAMLAKDLTQQLLTFSRGGAPVKKPSAIAELMKQTVVFALRGSDVRCEFDISDDLWTVEVDEAQISQVINNLVINADQAMPDGGVVKVHVKNAILNKENGLPLEDGEYVKVLVQDNGIGIPEEYIQKIFDPYFTTKQKGSGLGLATSYSIVKNHGGHLSVKSEVGVGTTFCVHIPASSKVTFMRRENRVSKPVMGRGKVLVMDDEESIRNLASEMLRSIGYEATTATDGTEAIRLYEEAKNSKKSYDAVIMDLTIPGGMGAKKAIQNLLKIDPEVKAIASSGYSNDPIMGNFKEYGFSSAIPKPYRVSALSEVLHEVIKRPTKVKSIW